MKLGLITGTVTATVKEPQLTGLKLLLTDVIDANGKVLEPAIVAVDTCGAGIGDRVLIVSGSAARMPSAVAGVPIDNSIIAVVDDVVNTETS